MDNKRYKVIFGVYNLEEKLNKLDAEGYEFRGVVSGGYSVDDARIILERKHIISNHIKVISE